MQILSRLAPPHNFLGYLQSEHTSGQTYFKPNSEVHEATIATCIKAHLSKVIERVHVDGMWTVEPGTSSWKHQACGPPPRPDLPHQVRR